MSEIEQKHPAELLVDNEYLRAIKSISVARERDLMRATIVQWMLSVAKNCDKACCSHTIANMAYRIQDHEHIRWIGEIFGGKEGR